MTPEDLVEFEHIKRLKYRYVRLLDQKGWDELADCFTADATASFGGGAYPFEGREAIMGFYRRNMSSTGMLTSHKVHQPEIELVSAVSATAVWALDDIVVHRDFAITVRGAAFYHDEYRKEEGVWRIHHTGYRRVYEEVEPRGAGLRVTASWWATDGRSELPAR